MSRSTRSKWCGALAAAATATLVAACGSSGDSAAPAGADPIKLMIISQLQAPTFAFPEIESMARAAVKPVNDAGGIGGRQIEVEACNDQGDANKAGACARQAASDEVDLVLGSFSLFGGSILPILEQAGIAYTGNTPLSPDDGTNPVSFPISGGTAASGAALGLEFTKRGCTQAGAIGFDQAASNTYVGYVEQGLKAGGGSLVAKATVAPGTPDYAPALATVVAGGAKCIFLSLPASESAKVLSAVAQSPTKPLLGSGVTSIPQQVIAGVAPEVVEGTILIGTSYAYTDDVDSIKQMAAQAQAAGVPQKESQGTYAVNAWVGATIAIEALKSIQGEVDAESVLAAMGKIDQPATGPIGAFTTTREFTAPGLNRLFNRNTLTYTVHGGKVVLDSPEWTDTSSALAGSPS